MGAIDSIGRALGEGVESLGNAFEDVVGGAGDALSGLDDWVRE
jgi:hypothetical protein